MYYIPEEVLVIKTKVLGVIVSQLYPAYPQFIAKCKPEHQKWILGAKLGTWDINPPKMISHKCRQLHSVQQAEFPLSVIAILHL